MQGNNRDDVVEIDLQDLFGLLLSRVWLLLLFTLMTGALAFGASAFLIAPKYESTTSIYILSKEANDSLTYSDTQLAAQLTKDYEKLITGRHVVEQVIETFHLEADYDDFVSKVTVHNDTDTRIINITVKDEDPVLARDLANEIRDVAAVHIQSVTDVKAVNVADTANLPLKPSEPSISIWTMIGAIIGFVASAVMIVVRYLLDDTVKSEEDIERYLELSTLALIPDSEVVEKKGKKKKVKNKRKSKQSPKTRKQEERALGLEVVDIMNEKGGQKSHAEY